MICWSAAWRAVSYDSNLTYMQMHIVFFSFFYYYLYIVAKRVHGAGAQTEEIVAILETTERPRPFSRSEILIFLLLVKQ